MSAPYEQQVRDRKVIREGLTWIDAEATHRFSTGFANCAAAQQRAILEDIATEGIEEPASRKSSAPPWPSPRPPKLTRPATNLS
ncbi:MAG TPA: gluconate 2-dehydrogenase subunit 3 family protein [Chthoniobacteraceae bacterium]